MVALGAIVAPALHTVTDAMEWINGGFTAPQLWLNYVAFLLIPAVMLGLYGIQRPQISKVGLAGALLYGFAFVYFAHTTLTAIAGNVPDYDQLWAQLGMIYTIHGVAMLVGGGAFGWATIRALSVSRLGGLAVSRGSSRQPARGATSGTGSPADSRHDDPQRRPHSHGAGCLASIGNNCLRR